MRVSIKTKRNEAPIHNNKYDTKKKDLLENIQSNSLTLCNSIKTFDFSTLYTSIPHSKIKDKLKELVLLCFIKKNGRTKI